MCSLFLLVALSISRSPSNSFSPVPLLLLALRCFVSPSCRYLHVRGDVLFFEDIPSLATTVFIDPNWLLHVVLGRALCPEGIEPGGLNPRNGEVSWEDIGVAFEDTSIAPQLVVDVLRGAHLCFEVCERDGQRYFMLPSRLTEDAVLGEVWQRPREKGAGCGGRRLVIGDAAFAFPAGFFAQVQAKLYGSFGETLHLWRDAFSACVGGAGCVGLHRSDREVDVWVWWHEGAKHDAWKLLEQVSQGASV